MAYQSGNMAIMTAVHEIGRADGIHEPLISQAVFDIMQTTLKKNSGRSETLQVKPEREYLLKGIVRCAYCGMPMWAQTYKSGKPFYREHKASRSHEICPGGGFRDLEDVLHLLALAEEVEEIKSELSERVDAYLEYVADEWIQENALVIEQGLKTEMTESFLQGMKSLFEDHYVTIPEDRYDVIESMVDKLDEMEAKLNEQIDRKRCSQ
jgi:hypothetical protein